MDIEEEIAEAFRANAENRRTGLPYSIGGVDYYHAKGIEPPPPPPSREDPWPSRGFLSLIPEESLNKGEPQRTQSQPRGSVFASITQDFDRGIDVLSDWLLKDSQSVKQPRSESPSGSSGMDIEEWLSSFERGLGVVGDSAADAYDQFMPKSWHPEVNQFKTMEDLGINALKEGFLNTLPQPVRALAPVAAPAAGAISAIENAAVEGGLSYAFPEMFREEPPQQTARANQAPQPPQRNQIFLNEILKKADASGETPMFRVGPNDDVVNSRGSFSRSEPSIGERVMREDYAQARELEQTFEMEKMIWKGLAEGRILDPAAAMRQLNELTSRREQLVRGGRQEEEVVGGAIPEGDEEIEDDASLSVQELVGSLLALGGGLYLARKGRGKNLIKKGADVLFRRGGKSASDDVFKNAGIALSKMGVDKKPVAEAMKALPAPPMGAPVKGLPLPDDYFLKQNRAAQSVRDALLRSEKQAAREAAEVAAKGQQDALIKEFSEKAQQKAAAAFSKNVPLPSDGILPAVQGKVDKKVVDFLQDASGAPAVRANAKALNTEVLKEGMKGKKGWAHQAQNETGDFIAQEGGKATTAARSAKEEFLSGKRFPENLPVAFKGKKKFQVPSGTLAKRKELEPIVKEIVKKNPNITEKQLNKVLQDLLKNPVEEVEAIKEASPLIMGSAYRARQGGKALSKFGDNVPTLRKSAAPAAKKPPAKKLPAKLQKAVDKKKKK